MKNIVSVRSPNTREKVYNVLIKKLDKAIEDLRMSKNNSDKIRLQNEIGLLIQKIDLHEASIAKESEKHPDNSPFWKTKSPAGKCRDQSGKLRNLREDDKWYYTWDYLHGEVEIFHKSTKKHFDAADKDTGRLLFKYDKSKTIKVGK